MTKPHTIMLSKQAISALKELQAYTGHGEYLFASRLASSPVSEATIRKAFRTNFSDYHIVPLVAATFLARKPTKVDCLGAM